MIVMITMLKINNISHHNNDFFNIDLN